MPLGQHLALLPMTDAYVDAVTVLGAPKLDGFWKVPRGFGSAWPRVPQRAPQLMSRPSTSAAPARRPPRWNDGQVVLGPLQLALKEPNPASGSPISQALRRLGVVKGDHVDEFDAIGLGRHRDTDDWLPDTD